MLAVLFLALVPLILLVNYLFGVSAVPLKPRLPFVWGRLVRARRVVGAGAVAVSIYVGSVTPLRAQQ